MGAHTRFSISNELPAPGLLWGPYPQRQPQPDAAGLPAWMHMVYERLLALHSGRQGRFVAQVRGCEKGFLAQDMDQIQSALRALRLSLGREGFQIQNVAQAFALAGVLSARLLGLRPFDTQWIAARIVLDGHLAEMATGEGKTLAVTLAASTAALAGIPVHIITANDYLVERDAAQMRPLYAALGLTVGCVTQTQDGARRQAAYACDITYCTAKELVFDYLRDGLDRRRGPQYWYRDQFAGAQGKKTLLRGLCMAIIDEADSILIDEARTPLILSRAIADTQERAQARNYLAQSLSLAGWLQENEDFRLDTSALAAGLTEAGRERLERAAADLPPVWRNRLHREEVVCAALAALHLFQRERHYLVREGKVLIVDENTGRIARGRAWSRGLHQLIELKEGCAASVEQETAAQITYPRFFSRYVRLAGLSGTLSESRAELYSLYRLGVRRVPLRKPCQRSVLPHRLFPDRVSLWDAVAARVATVHQAGRPVLVGTDSVADSEALSQRLQRAGLAHAILNARNDENEANIIAQAGLRGAITVATNMAGRGTDIPLADGVAQEGGLHLIGCQLNAARRIDRQLAGRSARQGDPGSAETWLSLESPLLAHTYSRKFVTLLSPYCARFPGALIRTLAGLAQRLAERRHALQRQRMLAHDEQMDQQLSFGGSGD